MSATSQSVDKLFGGISHQAPAQRYPSQHQDQVNIHNKVKSGPSKRMPTEHVAKITDTQGNGALVHTINRDSTERYKVVVLDGNIRVFDLDTGEEKVVGFAPDAELYLSSNDPANEFSLVTVADYTFVVNSTKQVGKLSDTVSGSFTGSKQRFTEVTQIDNPDNGDIYEVAGDYSSRFDNYYVVREGGVWRETARPGEEFKLDPDTMPHTLVRNADGTFTFKQVDWSYREAGDLQSVPFPSFVGSYMQYVFFYRNRLGFLTTRNVIMSRTGDFFNFFRETATDLLATDPIDVAASSTSVVTFRSAAPHNKTLMLNADQSQFVLNAGDILSPKSVSIDPTTDYVIRTKVDPVTAGPNVYFAAEAGSFTSLMEYYVEDSAVVNTAADVTAHVSSLLPAGVTQMASNSNFSGLFIVNNEKPYRMYVYQWYWQGDKKVMSAWNYWDMPGDVLSVASVDSYLIMVVRYDDGLYLERVNLDDDKLDSGLPYFVRLDRRLTVTGSYNSNDNETTWTLTDADASIEIDTSVDLTVIKDGSNGNESGVLVQNTTRPNNTQVKAPGDYGGVSCVIGVRYTAMTELSPLYLRNDDDSVLMGNLVLRSMRIAYSESGYFDVEVERLGANTQTIPVSPANTDPVTGRVIGSADWSLGTPSIQDGVVSVPVLSNARHVRIRIKNDSPLPSAWQQYEWGGEFTANYKV